MTVAEHVAYTLIINKTLESVSDEKIDMILSPQWAGFVGKPSHAMGWCMAAHFEKGRRDD